MAAAGYTGWRRTIGYHDQTKTPKRRGGETEERLARTCCRGIRCWFAGDRTVSHWSAVPAGEWAKVPTDSPTSTTTSTARRKRSEAGLRGHALLGCSTSWICSPQDYSPCHDEHAAPADFGSPDQRPPLHTRRLSSRPPMSRMAVVAILYLCHARQERRLRSVAMQPLKEQHWR